MPHKAIRYKSNGKYLKNTMFWTTNSDFLGAHHGAPTDAIFDPILAAEEEQLTIASHKQDFAVAFGIPAEEIECEVIPWDGDPKNLPYDEDAKGEVERLPEEQREGYVKPEPVPPTLEQKVEAMLAAMPATQQATVDEALKGV